LELVMVVTVGPQGDPAALGEQPDQVHVARYIPQAQLIPYCAAAVSHGGSGIFLAALMAGLPQLCVPQGADQFVNAPVCVRVGAGLAIQPGDVTADAIRATVSRLFNDPSFRMRAEDLGKQVASMPTPQDVADRLHRQFS
jgi:UDP:flavonoid glycosyltransferase YjiC (YdhE family)